MLHRIFIAINLPEDIKTKLLSYKEQWQDIPARWATKDNLHITLAFLGGRSDKEIEDIGGLIAKEASRRKPFTLRLEKIIYGPFDYAQGGPTKADPKMIWGMIQPSAELSNLQKGI